MADQTLDTRLELLLRETLKVEAATLPQRVTPDQVIERAKAHGAFGSRFRFPRWSMAIATGAAAVAMVAAVAVGINLFTYQKPGFGGPPATSPSPSQATSAPTPAASPS